MQTAIVILNWNGKELLSRFLGQVITLSPGAEVVVADNGSTDGSVAYLREKMPSVRVIELGKNLGFAGGYNEALKQVDATYYVLLNSDVEVTPGWLTPLADWMDNHAQCAACQPLILSFENKQLFEHAGAAGGFIDKYGYPFCRGRMFSHVEKNTGQYDDNVEVFWASGACAMLRAESFHHAGGFDNAFFAHMEEIDLCWRLKRAGHTAYCIPASKVYHIGGGTLPKHNPHKTYLNFRNNLMMLHKNLPPARLPTVFLVRLLLDKLAALKFLFDGDWKDFGAVLKAYAHFYRHIWKRKKTRRQLEKEKLQYGVTRMYRGSLVVACFIRGIRKFSGLGQNFT